MPSSSIHSSFVTYWSWSEPVSKSNISSTAYASATSDPTSSAAGAIERGSSPPTHRHREREEEQDREVDRHEAERRK